MYIDPDSDSDIKRFLTVPENISKIRGICHMCQFQFGDKKNSWDGEGKVQFAE